MNQKKAIALVPNIESILKEDLALGLPDGNGKKFSRAFIITYHQYQWNGQRKYWSRMAKIKFQTDATAVLI